MSWARYLNEKLVAGEAAQFICHQDSIAPLVPKGSLCEVAPFDKRTLIPGDIVLCRTGGWHKLCQVAFIKGHRVSVMDGMGLKKYEIKMNQVTARLKILESCDGLCVGS